MDVKQKKKRNRSKQSCCVPDCNTPGYVIEDNKSVTFHVLPKDEKLLKIWIVKIKRDIGPLFQVTHHTKICSRHFTDSDFRITFGGKKYIKPSAVPSIFMRESRSSYQSRTTKNSTSLISDSSSSLSISSDETIPAPIDTDDAVSVPDCPSKPTVTVTEDVLKQLQAKIRQLEREVESEKAKGDIHKKERDHVRNMLEARTSELEETQKKKQFSIEQFQNSDSDICYYTGFPTLKALQECFSLLNPANNIMYIDAHDHKRTLKDIKLSYMNQFFLILVRLRLGLLVKDLTHRFSISMTSANRYFTAWLNFMYLRLGSLNIWPTKEYITRTMPESMKEKYPNLEWIIDAFEIQTQRPASLLLQSQSYSNYKSRNTVKGLVACTPSGQAGFVSQLYTGNISDRELTERSGFLNMPHNKGAMWLVDKGFEIADLAQPLGVSINIPNFVGNRSQMTAEEVFHTQSVASERIHIERCINKIKKFHYFDRPIPLSSLGSANQAWLVCAMLTLFQNPIISA